MGNSLPVADYLPAHVHLSMSPIYTSVARGDYPNHHRAKRENGGVMTADDRQATRVSLPILGAPSPPPPRPVVPECYGDVCITCSDEAVAVTIVELLADELARVDTGQSIEEVSVALVDAQVGDVILVHAKEAIAVVRD